MSLKSVHIFRWNKLLLIPLLLGALLVWLLWPQQSAVAGWFDDSWLYRTAYNITNSGSAISAERKIKLDIDTATLITAGKLQSDCDDARFTDINGKLLDYFIDTDTGACNTSSTDFYIKVLSVIAGTQTIYFYYGNPSASSGRKNDFFAPDTTGQGLKAYYKMDESAANGCTGGTNDTCDSALTNDGAWTNGPTSTTGKIGNGVNFDGTDDYVRTSNMTFSNTHTVSVWFKPQSTINSGSGRKDIWYAGENYFILNFSGSDGKLSWLVSIDAANREVESTTTSWTAGDWYHIVGNYDGSTLRLYVNGVLENSTPYSGSVTSNSYTPDMGSSAGTNPFSGTLDDTRIYSRALSAEEIASIYNSGTGTSINVPLTFTQSATAAATEEQSPGPVAAWSFDEGTGTTAQDSTANNNDGTLTNGPVWKNESDCISGKCLFFDGSNDYVAVTDSPFDLTDLVLSAWIKTSQTSRGTIVGKGTTSDYQYALEINPAGNTNKVAMTVWQSGGTDYLIAISSATINDNQWHYLSGVVSGNNAYIYVDGKLSGTDTTTNGTRNSSGASSVRVGYRGDDAIPFQGFIDEVRIYPYARTAAQIKTDFAARGTTQGVSAQFGAGGAGSGEKLSNGLVAYYPMDENAANSCTGGANDTCDKSGNGNDGAWNGDATTTTGKYGNGTTYDGTGDYITTSSNSIFNSNTNTEFTYSAWIYASSYNAKQVIMSRRNSCNNDGTFNLFVQSNGVTFKWYSDIDATTYTLTSLSSPLVNGQWHHITWVQKWGKTGSSLYLNGNKISLSGGTGATGNGTTYTLPIYIGAQNGGSGCDGPVQNFLNGKLDEVRIYNRALSPAEVRALYTWAPGPVAHWKLDENTGTSATDISGNSRTGTLNGNSTWTPGKFGSGVKLDGSGDYIQVSDF